MKQLPILFTYDDLKEAYPTAESFYAFVDRSVKNGSIKQIKRGLYALVDPSTRNIYANKFQIASRLFNDSYFSYHEALEYYGLANQSFVSTFTYLTHTYVNDLSFEGVTYISKKNLNTYLVVDRMKEEGVRVVSLERAIIDSIDSPSLAGGLEEIEYALSSLTKLNWDGVKQLLRQYNKAYLYQKVGYLFEKYFADKAPESLYEICLKHVGKKIMYFECNSGKSKLVSKWKLMVKKEDEIDELFQ